MDPFSVSLPAGKGTGKGGVFPRLSITCMPPPDSPCCLNLFTRPGDRGKAEGLLRVAGFVSK